MKVAGIVIELPKTWQWANCSEVIDVRDGTHETPKYVSEGYPLVTSKNLKPDGIDFSTISYISEKDHLEISKRSRVDRNDILFAMIGTIGNPVLVDIDTEFSIKNVALFKFANSPIDPRYFRYLLKTRIIERQLDFEERGGTQKFVSLKVLRNMKIPYPPLEEQRRIAAILDKADGVRRKRKEAIRLTEELLKSTFLEMFGDPVTNPKGWEVKTIEDITVNQKGAIKRGPFGGALKKDIFIQAGFLVYEQYHALNNDFSFERYYISEDKFEEMKGFEVKPGDIIISCSGVYLGKLAIVPENAKPGIINQALLRITLNQRKMNNYFFLYHFSHESFRDKFFAANRGSGVPNFPPISEFKTFPFIVPPIEDQNKFSARLQQIQGFQSKAYESIKESENLFNSLLQRAFRGEL